MKNLETSIKLHDMMSAPLQKITSELTRTVDLAAKMQLELDKSGYDGAMFDATRADIASLNVGLGSTAVGLERAKTRTEAFGSALRRLAGPIAAIFTVGKAIRFVDDSLKAAAEQIGIERQLKTVLENVGATKTAFEDLKVAAESWQGRSTYDAEMMLGGAAEFATYMSDAKAIESMMGTLANYATGMSGGAEVTLQQMVDYATQLGKAFDGTYDGLKKKGFELTEQQKYIIETGTEMQKALVLDEVISQSWANLAEQMASTPQGKITQVRNLIGDIREDVGIYLYPYVMRLYQVILDNMPLVERFFGVVSTGLGYAITLVTVLINGLFGLYNIISVVWDIASPVMAHLAAAFAIYYGWQLLVNGTLLVWRSHTLVAAAAQWVLNSALFANPLTWIILLLAGVVWWLRQTSDSSLSLAGVFFGAVNFIISIVVELYNLIAVFANFFATAFNNPVAAIVHLFSGLLDFILGVVEASAGLIDIILGSDMSGAVANWRKSMADFVVDLVGEQTVVMQKLNATDFHVSADSLSGFLGGGAFGGSGMAGNIEETAYNTGEMREALSDTQEDLKYLRDIAEREAINRFTTAEIRVEVNNNNKISSNVDAQGLLEEMGAVLTERIVAAAEGVHR